MAASLKEAFASITPIGWADLPSDETELASFLRTLYRHAEQIVNSIPAPSAPADAAAAFRPLPANSAEKAADTATQPEDVPALDYGHDAAAQKAWGKPYKMSAKENPLHVNCYKMAAQDRHGAYFARRSVHQGVGFDRWRRCAEREFLESLKVQDAPGAGAVRGISADRRVEKKHVKGVGDIEVWQTSSAFPGPVTPRECLTMVISARQGLSDMPDGKPPPRHFIVISRPTTHDDAPNRSNLVKMAYESVEVVREVPIEGNDDPEANPVEWLMVTRSDPGGGIPKFMVERGTPSSIVGDVAKFIEWAIAKPWSEIEDDLDEEEGEVAEAHNTVDRNEGKPDDTTGESAVAAEARGSHPSDKAAGSSDAADGGLFSRAAGAAGAMASMAAGYLPGVGTGDGDAARAGHDSDGDDDDDGALSDYSSSSSGTFASALDEPDLHHHHKPHLADDDEATPRNSTSTSLARSSNSDPTSSKTTLPDRSHTGSSKELARLAQKRVDIDARAAKDREAIEKRIAAAHTKDAAARDKALERQEGERRKTRERHEAALAKLDARHAKEQRREAERQRKLADKDEVARLRRERDEWRDRCGVAEREAGLLRAQVDALMREQTAAVARLPDEQVAAVREEVGGLAVEGEMAHAAGGEKHAGEKDA